MKGGFGPTVRRLLRFLPDAGGDSVTPLEAASRLGLPIGIARAQLWRLARLGHVERVRRGQYRLAAGFRWPRDTRGPVTDRVLDAVARAGRPLGPSEIASRLGHPLTAVHQVVARAASRGLLERVSIGLYRAR